MSQPTDAFGDILWFCTTCQQYFAREPTWAFWRDHKSGYRNQHGLNIPCRGEAKPAEEAHILTVWIVGGTDALTQMGLQVR